MIAGWISRIRQSFAPPRASFSYRYRPARKAPNAGPISAIHVVVEMDLRVRNHALAEGEPDPIVARRHRAEEEVREVP